MKVLIINSPLFRHTNKLYDEDSLPPIGLGYIATILQENNIEVNLIDAVANKISLKELIENINTEKPDFIASNIFTTNYDLVKDLIESINYKAHIIIGGLSTKELYKKILDWRTKNKIDIVTGDGEFITLAIVTDTLKDEPVIKETNRRVFQVNSNSNYIVNDISNLPLNRDFFVNEPVQHPLGFLEANIVASRGCIYNCTFCAAARSLNADYPVRERTEISISKELSDIKEKYPLVNSIRVLDDLFLKTKNSVQKAINVFSNFNYSWRSMAHVMTFNAADDILMASLKQSGCFELFIGIESGSPKILSQINKTKNIDTIINNISKAFKAGINIKGYFIYGFPDETIEDMEMTYNLAKTLKNIALEKNVNFRTSVFQYRPYHATQIYHDLEAQGSDLKVQQMQPDANLSSLVGRLQFNFHSGNFSKVDKKIIDSYIYRTINLNGGEIFSGLKSINTSV
ncbi:MAG: B12-binding domain-containing radical SAM protein [Parafilimonas sp.]|nr:B12-binding domain-containing radical SAM protein [Parafilimonas sp.]